MNYKDPRVIIRDEIDTMKEGLDYANSLGIPATPDLMERMAVSSHIQADRNGYRGPDSLLDTPRPPRVVTLGDEPEGDPEAPTEAETSSDAPNPDWQQPNNGFNYDSRHPVSEKQKELITDLMAKAKRVVDDINKKGPIAAEKVIMKAISEPFKEQRGHEINLSSYTRMTGGDGSWTIDFLKRTWDIRG